MPHWEFAARKVRSKAQKHKFDSIINTHIVEFHIYIFEIQ